MVVLDSTEVASSATFIKSTAAMAPSSQEHVKISQMAFLFSGQVWMEIWLSAKSATAVRPCGVNLCVQVFKCVDLATEHAFSRISQIFASSSRLFSLHRICGVKWAVASCRKSTEEIRFLP